MQSMGVSFTGDGTGALHILEVPKKQRKEARGEMAAIMRLLE